MKPETIASIRMLASADPDADNATVARIVAACEQKPTKRELITSKDVCARLGFSRITLWKYIKRGVIHPIYYSPRLVKFDKMEIECFANNGVR